MVSHKHLDRWAARWWRGSFSKALIEKAPCSALGGIYVLSGVCRRLRLPMSTRRSSGAHRHRSSCGGQGAQYRLRGKTFWHAAAGASLPATLGRAQRRGVGRAGHRRRRTCTVDGAGRFHGMSSGSVQLTTSGNVASVVFNRPESRSAMIWAMYERLNQICEQLQNDTSIRVVTFRGAGGQEWPRRRLGAWLVTAFRLAQT